MNNKKRATEMAKGKGIAVDDLSGPFPSGNAADAPGHPVNAPETADP
jgi:hypothetical protein